MDSDEEARAGSPGGTTVSPFSDEKAPTPSEQSEQITTPPRDIAGWRWVVMLAILSTQLLFALDNTIVANVQPVIVQKFGAVASLSWISLAFLIGAAATKQISGKVFDQINATWTYILYIVLFEAGSVLCGAAPPIEAFIVGRAI